MIKQHTLLIIKRTLMGLIPLLVISFVISFFYMYKEENIKARSKSEDALSQAIKIHVNNANIPVTGYYDSNKVIGSEEVRFYQSEDTSFTYRRKVKDFATELFNDLQDYLLETGNLHAQDIQLLYDSLLHEEAIYASTVIGIQSSFLIKTNDWSQDTTQIKTNFKTSLTEQGTFEDINYYAYANLSLSTIWKLMPHTLLYILLSSAIVCCILLFITIKRIEQNRNSFIGIKLTPQLTTILNMFLNGGHRVSKEKLKYKIWGDKTEANTSMTSAIHRLNEALKENRCEWSIIVDPSDDTYYILIRTRNNFFLRIYSFVQSKVGGLHRTQRDSIL